MAVIEEEDAQAGPSGDSYEGTEGWQDVGQQEDMSDAGWAVGSMMDPGNGNDNWAVANDAQGWEINSAAAPPAPPPPPQPQQQKHPGGGKAQTRHQQQQFAQPQQHRHEQQHPQHVNTSSMGQTAWNHSEGVKRATWNTAKNPNMKDGAWTTWANEGSWDVQSAAPDSMEDWSEGNSGNDLNNWGQTGSAWGRSASVPSAHTHTTSYQRQSGWQNWSAEAQRLPKIHQPYTIPQDRGGTYPQAANVGWQQAPQAWPPPNTQKTAHQQPPNHDVQHEYHDGNGNGNGKKNKKNRKQKKQQHQESNDVWGLGGGWNDQDETEDDSVGDDWGRKVHFPPSNNGVHPAPPAPPAPAPRAPVDPFSIYASPTNSLGITLYPNDTPMSKTLAYAYHGTGASPGGDTGRIAMRQLADVHFIESHGKAIQGVWNAFYNRRRKADDRFHWLFPPGKDERVAGLMAWIDMVSAAIASYGLQKFLQTRQRGALFVNADYSPPQAPDEPALDWMTWEQIQPTMDRVLQESVGYYKPATHVVIFVYLSSPSGNSVAIWRRKLAIPDNVRLAYQAQITQIISALPAVYRVLVDELPKKPDAAPPPPPKEKKKRKWYKLWLFS